MRKTEGIEIVVVLDKTDAAVDQVKHGLVNLITEAAILVQAQAAMRAPVRTGYLRNSIRVEKLPSPDDLEGVVGVGAHYGVYVEFGTRRMAARPYVAPAVDESEKFIKKRLQDLLEGF